MSTPSYERAAVYLGERLRELRQRHGLTQEQAASVIGIEYKRYQTVEWGRRNLRLETLQRIATAFHLEVWELFWPELPVSKIEQKSAAAPAPHKPKRPRGRPPGQPQASAKS